jgi:hypothetical protein
MSLKLAAEHLKRQGRGSDTELVHMTKDEVRGLQTMAKAHGGSLTINPETGLAEAGFLSGILPMLAGAAAVALAPETGGLSLEAYSAIAAGGIGLADYAITGNLKQGIMAGVGAYGGANLASGLANLGSQAAITEGGDLAIKGAQETLKSSIPTELGDISSKTFQPIGQELGSNVSNMTNLSTAQQAAIQEQLAQQTTNAGREAVLRGAGQANTAFAPASYGSTASNIGSGLKAASAAPGAFLANNVSNIGMAAAPVLTGAFNNPTMPGGQQQQNPFNLKSLSPNFQGSFPERPNPAYQAKYTDYTKNPYQPGAQRMAVGGVAQDKNFTSGGMYPGSQIDYTQYALSPQTPMSMQTTLASYDPETNPLTGEPTNHMASGGITSYAGKTGSLVDAANAYNAATTQEPVTLARTSGADPGIYTDTDPNTRDLDAYNAALYNFKKRSKKAGMGKDAVALKEAKQLGDIESEASGGIIGMAFGGAVQKAVAQAQTQPSTTGNFQPSQSAAPQVYRPNYANYANYAQTPFDPSMAQAYGGIPIPTRSAMPNSTGYAIDPKGMVGSPQYAAVQAELKAAQDRLDALNSSGDGYAMGGSISGLGGYSDGGRLLKGPGDGMSDSIPAQIGKRQPARLADGEFVVPADVVSHIGNGSTEAGAKQLYAMMDKIRNARTGKKKQAPQVKPGKYLPK